MIQFNVVNKPEEKQDDTVVDAELKVSEGSRLYLLFDGIEVMCVGVYRGNIHPMLLAPNEVEALREKGIEIRCDKLEVG